MRVAVAADLAQLQARLTAKGPPWDRFEYKLNRDRIIIYTPVIPFSPDTHKPDPALRYLAMHLRVSPVPGGPFQLEYRRHTEQWWPLPVRGTIDEVADGIAMDAVGLCAPSD